MNDNVVKFAIEDINRFRNDEDMEMAIARVKFLSTRPNSHGLIISEEVLREYAPTVLGKWMIAEYDKFVGDVTTHTNNQNIVGVVSKDAEIEFVRAEDGYLDAYVDAVISKLYATNVYELFLSHNERSVSVEMTTDAEDGVGEVECLCIRAITILGLSYNPSVPKANIRMVRFSEDDANKFYSNYGKKSELKKFAEERKDLGKKYKIDKSKEAMSDDDWSNVDKTTMRNKIMSASNKSTLVKSVYLKVEDGWENSSSEKLGYPIMQLKGDTFVYNRRALGNAKARATQQNETSVLKKLDSIYKKLDLKEEVESTKMADVKEKDVVMEDNKEVEDKEKMATTEDSENKEVDSKEEKMEENSDEEKEDTDDDEDKEKMGCGDKMSETTDSLMAKLAEKEDVIKGYESELAELRKFKADTEEAQKMAVVNQTLAKVKDKIDTEQFAKFEESGKVCKFEEVNTWKNGVLASIVDTVLQFSEKEDGITRMELPNQDSKTKSLWDRI